MAPKVRGEDGQEYLDYSALDTEVRKAMNDQRIANNAEMLSKTQKNVSEVELQELVNNNVHWSVVNNTYRNSLSQFNTLMKDPSVPLDKKLTTIDLLANQQKLEFSTKFGKFYNKPEIKEAADFLNKQIDGLVTALKNDTSGKNFAEILETNSKINTKLSELELRNMGIDPVYTKTLSDLAPYLNKFNLNPKLENDLINYGNLTVSGILKKMQDNSANPKDQNTVNNVFQPGSIMLQNGQKLSINGGYLNSSMNNISKGDATVVPVFKQSIDISDLVSSAVINQIVDELEITAMGDTAHRYVAGLQSGTFTIDFMNDWATSEVSQTLNEAFGKTLQLPKQTPSRLNWVA